ncbi:MAG: FtsX-like permease family protein [Caldilineaceae bacterium]
MLLSIAVGVAAIGMVMGAQAIVDRSLPKAYAAVNPASATIFTLNTFGDNMIEAIRAMPEVAEAEARRNVTVRFRNAEDESYSLTLYAIPDYDNITINKITPEEGEYPPPEKEFLLERASRIGALGLGDIEIGDTLEVESPSGKKRTIRLAGTVHDMSQLPAYMNGSGYGYITFDTLAWLGEPRDYNQVVFVVQDHADDLDHINDVAKLIQKRMESSGIDVLFTFANSPGKHPAQNILDALSLVLGGIGILALLLSGFLIINTLSAIMTQHVRQIGIMKSVGARTGQITTMYLMMVLLFGVLALMIAIPLGVVGAIGLSSLFAGLLNFDVEGFHLDARIVLIQTVIALSAPLLAALIPIYRGVRVTVREAISEVGLGKGQFGTNFMDHVILGVRRVIPMARPMQISLRNTFRRKARLSLTLVTLSLASAIFISIFSIRASLQQTLNEVLDLFDYDVQVIFDRTYRTDRIVDQIQAIPGVDRIETWGFGSARLVHDDDTESDTIIVYAPRADSEMVHPILVEGRWIEEDDANAIVVNTDVLKDEEGVGVGDTITLTINDKESDWVIVGLMRSSMIGPMAFTNYDYYSRVINAPDRAIISQARLVDRSPENQLRLGQVIEDSYRDSGFRVQQMQTIGQLRTTISTIFDGIIGFLLAMALLLGIVGGLGLMGTMSINVMERTREIGVMRAIGASNRSILRIILVEGLIIGLISWIVGGLIAIPASQGLTIAVGTALLESAPTYIFSTTGALLWLLVVLALAFMASFLPARRASRLTVREVLSYE